MALSKEEILDAIAEMSVIDIVDLIEACLLYTSDAADD